MRQRTNQKVFLLVALRWSRNPGKKYIHLFKCSLLIVLGLTYKLPSCGDIQSFFLWRFIELKRKMHLPWSGVITPQLQSHWGDLQIGMDKQSMRTWIPFPPSSAGSMDLIVLRDTSFWCFNQPFQHSTKAHHESSRTPSTCRTTVLCQWQMRFLLVNRETLSAKRLE